ncbi:synaphin protein [Trichinella nativa]|uniref:Synaphin protein n=1 Tax=Trichinella nativa TaxID=6335 RepID=A0A1Y3ERK1_9BILA|nr:synaphin protein [Trichinella nativa]
MAGFIMKQVMGDKLNDIKGGLDKLTGDGGGEAKTESGEDPEVIQARLEAEERRQEKHRKMEREREKMRKDIREKVNSLYGIQKKDPLMPAAELDGYGRIGSGFHKSPEQLAKDSEEAEEGLMGQVNEFIGKAKTAVTDVAATVKNYLPFGK